MKDKYRQGKWMLLVVLLLVAILISSSVGSADMTAYDSLRLLLSGIPWIGNDVDVSDMKDVYSTILFRIRLPRIVLAGLVGAGLSVTGAVFQGLFRNPLADPHVLGVSSGAAVGATIAILTGVNMSFPGLGAIGIFAFAGAMMTILLVYRIAAAKERVSVVNLLLVGTAISTLLSSGISLMMSMNQDNIDQVYMWTLGSFSAATWTKVGYMAVLLLLCLAGLITLANDLNILVTGEDTAESLGVNLQAVKKKSVFFASLLVAGCVSVSGIIGFVGLVIPHCMRFLFGSDHRYLLPFSVLGGAVFMILCDTLARTVTAPSEIPVGVITSLAGAPYFIYLIYKNSRK